jgi:hypothetical protein
MALRVAVTLGIPTRLRGDGDTVEHLARDLAVSPVGLGLLLAHLATIGVVERTEATYGATAYRTTAFGTPLCPDVDPWLTMMLDATTATGRSDLAFVEMAHSVATGQEAYSRRYGQDFWTDATEYPQLRDSFDAQMTARFVTQVPQIVAGVDWSRFATLVDVGGGHGTLLAAVLEAHPAMTARLVDLERTATGAAQTFQQRALRERATAIAASFFDPLPAGADAYLLCDILHDWDDQHARRILSRCADAARPDSRILVIEAIGDRHTHTAHDLAMLVFYGGRGRHLHELSALAEPLGLLIDTVIDVSDHRTLVELRPSANTTGTSLSGELRSFDREAYTAGKQRFIEDVNRRANPLG